MIRIFFIALAVLSHVCVYAQDTFYLHIKGTIVDKITGAPIPGASIFLTKSAAGTFSNEAGEFDLAIADSLRHDTLVISSIGYKSYRERIMDLDDGKNHLIALQEDEIVLQEVVVSSAGEWARELVEKALKRLPKNVATKQFLAQAFYRELSLRDSTYVRLIEAAVELQDYGYGSTLERMKVKVLELRKSEDYITYGWGTKMSKLLFGDDNMLYKTINSDFLRNYKFNRKLAPIDSRDFVEEYTFSLEGYTSFDADSIAIIGFHSDETAPRPYYEGRLFIGLADLAIIRMEYGMVASPTMKVRQQNDVFYQGKFFFKATVEYRNIDHKYYLSRVSFIKPQNFDAVQNGQGQQYTIFDFAVNNIFTTRKEFDRIKRKEAQQRDVDLYNQEFTYNPTFWSTYNMVRLNPLLKKAETDLEKNKKLEEQFHKN